MTSQGTPATATATAPKPVIEEFIELTLPYANDEVLRLTTGASCWTQSIPEYNRDMRAAIADIRVVVDESCLAEPGKAGTALNKLKKYEFVAKNYILPKSLSALSSARKSFKQAYDEMECIKKNHNSQDSAKVTTGQFTEVLEWLGAAEKKLESISTGIKDAMDEYTRNRKKTVLVVGGGVSGLMTAWILLDKGYRVSIVAKEWAESDDKKEDRFTSQIAGALWEYPPGGCGLSEIEVPLLAYSTLKKYREWALQSFVFYDKIKSITEFGARTIPLYQFFHYSPEDLKGVVEARGKIQSNESLDSERNEKLGILLDAAGLDEEMWTRTEKNTKQHHDKCEKLKSPSTEDSGGHDFKNLLEVTEIEIPKNKDDLPEDAKEWKAILGEINSDKLRWAYKHNAPVINTDKAMKYLMELVRSKGAILETREIEGDLHLHERELMDDFQADIIVNASGLGARTLANDDQVFPVRGAVRRIRIPYYDLGTVPDGKAGYKLDIGNPLHNNAILIPAQYDATGQPTKTVFIVPREPATSEKTGILIVGSLIQRNNWGVSSLTVKSPELTVMWNRAKSFIVNLPKDPNTIFCLPEDKRGFAKGLRPFSHSNVRVSADGRTNSCRVVHNYGHGGSGWTLAVGCAWTCVKVLEKMLHEKKSGCIANAEIFEIGKSSETPGQPLPMRQGQPQ
ncbi:hypothetical protein TWF730_003281 [Orbilia blumenaviensis]|uniref:FAD dependent oxidoreductase domain-containing protein n=1 Tax=Orbilia blumenaviensis TaxID=1796055 RepID=A0AAV9U537_9PEZI